VYLQWKVTLNACIIKWRTQKGERRGEGSERPNEIECADGKRGQLLDTKMKILRFMTVSFSTLL
jgi:hypothetical protein